MLTAPPADAQRGFVSDVLQRLVRLSYWDKVACALAANPEHKVR